jgi:hypothetical protein
MGVKCWQQKTHRPVQFQITRQTREAIAAWIQQRICLQMTLYFLGRLRDSAHISTRQYARTLHDWVREVGLHPAAYGTHARRRMKASLSYRRTKHL